MPRYVGERGPSLGWSPPQRPTNRRPRDATPPPLTPRKPPRYTPPSSRQEVGDDDTDDEAGGRPRRVLAADRPGQRAWLPPNRKGCPRDAATPPLCRWLAATQERAAAQPGGTRRTHC